MSGQTEGRTPWTPDQPLRADATDEDITRRRFFLIFGPDESGRTPGFVPHHTIQIARELAAASRRAQPDTTADEIGWLLTFRVEQKINGVRRPTWAKAVRSVHSSTYRREWVHHEFEPTHDANEALRFARKQDAETALQIVSAPYRALVFVEEHMWPAALSVAAEPKEGAPPESQSPVECLHGYRFAEGCPSCDGHVTLAAEAVREIVDDAHKHGFMSVSVHVPTLELVLNAAEDLLRSVAADAPTLETR